MKQMDAVFSGKVEAVAADKANRQLVVVIEVSRFWKGEIPATITLTTPENSAMCGVHFEEGESYLIYATGKPEESLSTNLCTRTAKLRDAEADLKALGDPKLPEA